MDDNIAEHTRQHDAKGFFLHRITSQTRLILLLLVIIVTAGPRGVASRPAISGNDTAHHGSRQRHARWIEQGIAHSRDGHAVLIADKRAHIMHLYQNGIRQTDYPVELGMETDAEGGFRPTPIGTFELKYKAYTRYHKALLFKMPGYFEIHGGGTGLGKHGEDWTFGCIALSNSDMDDLFNRLGIEKNGMAVGPEQRRRALLAARLIVVPDAGGASN
ncbi:MAG: L,D-transpeptidase [Deltaproteobacteria bacterium]|nr:L,D-transpeptidase [Deltaproteobacteria bacterium]